MEHLPKHRKSPWHAGERHLQEAVHATERMEVIGQKVIRDYMPDQHREFYHQLPFMVVGAVDADGRSTVDGLWACGEVGRTAPSSRSSRCSADCAAVCSCCARSS